MENELLQKVKDEVAQANHFADWFQIDMTDMEQCQRDEIKAMMLDDVAIKYAEAYAAKQSQKQHLVELMKMDEEKDREQCFTVDDVEKVWWIDKHAALAHLNTRAAAFRLDGMKKALDSVLNILKENQTASSQLVPEDAARSAQDIINETFSDLIEIVQSIKPKKP